MLNNKKINFPNIDRNNFSNIETIINNDIKQLNKMLDNIVFEYKDFDTDTNILDFIKQVSDTLIKNPGKKLRPKFCFLSARIFNNNNCFKKVELLAACVELIHLATLLHDDVIDDSANRRGVKTAKYLFDNKASILVGDFLFAKAFQYMVLTKDQKCLDILSNASLNIIKGEISQLPKLNNFELSKDEYINTLYKKTGILFESSCKAGAIASYSDNQLIDINTVDKLAEFGKNFGIMYQIIDDCLDYLSDARGKAIAEDFMQRKITLPVLIACKNSNSSYLKDVFIMNCDHDKQEDISFKDVLSYIKNNNGFLESFNITKMYFEKLKDLEKHFQNNEYFYYLLDIAKTFLKSLENAIQKT